MFMVVIQVTSRQEVDPERDEEDEDLLKSTNCFDQSNIIGCGGFGLVFKATLPDGGKVAIRGTFHLNMVKLLLVPEKSPIVQVEEGHSS